MPNGNPWNGYLVDAEDFFISYMTACEIPNLSTCLFLIGHSVELFLKAVFIKQTNDENTAINTAHNVRELFELCQGNDLHFMPNLGFKGTFQELYGISRRANENLTHNRARIDGFTCDEVDKFTHFIEHQEFYYISENLMNLKYYHSRWRGRNPFFRLNRIYVPTIHPNPFWIGFVKDVERYFGYDPIQIKERFERYYIGGLSGLSVNTDSWLSRDLYV